MQIKVKWEQAEKMSKVDFRKELKALYNPPSKEVAVVDVPPMNFIMVDGVGNPNDSKQYQDAFEALFVVSYRLKFMIKRGKPTVDYAVMPLEGLWWIDDAAKFDMENKDKWHWTSIVMQPKYVTETLFKDAFEQVKKKKDLPALSNMRFENYLEGLSAQIMHIGSYAQEKPTVDKLHGFIGDNRYEFNGKHHEIYLSDPRKTAPEKIKTIIRQPIRRKQ